MTHDALNLTSAIVGGVACGLLSWRVLSTWLDTTVLVHVLGGLLIASVVVGALSNLVTTSTDAADDTVLWLMLVHRVLCIVVALMWNVWLDRKRPPHHAPILT